MPQALFDALSGAAGHPVNRPGLEAFVANSQAINGLRSAQTEEALQKAQEAQEEQAARGKLGTSLASFFGPGNESKANVTANVMAAGYGSFKDALAGLNEWQTNQANATLGDPSKLNTPDQTAAMQVRTGKLAEPVAVPHEYATPAGVAAPQVQQTPLGQAQTAATQASADLHGVQADAGGWNPHSGGGMGSLSPEHVAALQQAVKDGRLDPARINSRTAPILAEMEAREPGGVNFNRLHADATLQSNAAFQQKAMSVDMLPGLLQNVTSLGKKVGYNDNATVGLMQKWMNKEFNDPTYTEYMTTRNDTLLRLAGVMRGVGMSDQAHTAEVEAMSPTLAPYALDAWLKGQMAVVTPLLARQNRITHLGEKGQGTPQMGATDAPAAGPGAAPVPAPSAAAPISLDEYLKQRGH